MDIKSKIPVGEGRKSGGKKGDKPPCNRVK
jgi:hypothetical protein